MPPVAAGADAARAACDPTWTRVGRRPTIAPDPLAPPAAPARRRPPPVPRSPASPLRQASASTRRRCRRRPPRAACRSSGVAESRTNTARSADPTDRRRGRWGVGGAVAGCRPCQPTSTPRCPRSSTSRGLARPGNAVPRFSSTSSPVAPAVPRGAGADARGAPTRPRGSRLAAAVVQGHCSSRATPEDEPWPSTSSPSMTSGSPTSRSKSCRRRPRPPARSSRR